MEQQNPPSSTILPNAFTNSTFGSTFPGISSAAGNVSNPLLMSTLQHLQGLSNSGNTTLLPGTSQLKLGTQFASEFNNIAAMGWPAQNTNTSWFEQAKAAMLPMYSVLPASGVKSNDISPMSMNSPAFSMHPKLKQNSGVAIPSTVASATVFAAGIFPLDPCGFLQSAQNCHSQPATPKQAQHQRTHSLHSSPANAFLNSDTQQNSISSHCPVEIRPDSNSAVSSHGSNSVHSVHMHSIGSVEGVEPCSSTDLNSGLASLGNVNIGTCSERVNQAFIHNLHVTSGNSSEVTIVPASSDIHSTNNAQQIAYDLTMANPQTVACSFSDSSMDAATTTTNDQLINDFSIVSDRQSPGSPHDNALDSSNLEDLPWSGIDFTDIDLFGGASGVDKDVMHSMLAMDPSAMQRMFPNDPSSSVNSDSDGNRCQRSPLSSVKMSQAVTPKIREKIKNRREKELADADKELDRLLCLVAKNDSKPVVEVKTQPTFPAFNPLLLLKPEPSDDRKISLSPVQFTPPDSPTPSTSEAGSKNSFFFPSLPGPSTSSATNSMLSRPAPSVSVSPFVFMSAVEKKSKPSKVPVYKQKAKSFLTSEIKKEEENAGRDDAYSFNDEEEEDKPLPTEASLSKVQLKEKRLDAEVAQKIAKINSAHCETKGKGSAYESQNQQDLWRHVVPKKRHTSVAERPSVPSTPLLPPASSFERVDVGLAAQKSPELLTLAETLQRRKQYRSSYGFLRTKCLDDIETAVDEDQSEIAPVNAKTVPINDRKTENGLHRPLPKLLIRIPRKSVELLEKEKVKVKKKKKKRDRDYDWEGSQKTKKKRKHKHKHRKRESSEIQYESHLIGVDGEQWRENQNMTRMRDFSMFSRKHRLMMQWNETEETGVNNHGEENGQGCAASYERSQHNLYEDEKNDWKMLTRFSKANGQVAKGTFVVCKMDIFKDDCPLWRVDNQNLLQKYPKIQMDGKIVYRNSSTYSGWCEQIAGGYLVIQVRFIKHSRSETIVEPEVPLLDMFPAISSEVEENSLDHTLSNGDQQPNHETDFFAKDPIRDLMITYVRAMLNHSLSLNFLQSVKQGNDWNYLRALNDIDKINLERKERVLSRVKWVQRYIEMLQFYSCCAISDAENDGLMCQACHYKNIEKVVQLFTNEGYDYETLECCEIRYTGCGSPMPAMEYLVCSFCAKNTVIYHRLHHMRYSLLKICEEEMENTSLQNLSASSDSIVETCMRNTQWLHSVVNEYTDLWRKIEMNDL